MRDANGNGNDLLGVYTLCIINSIGHEPAPDGPFSMSSDAPKNVESSTATKSLKQVF